MTPTYSFKKGLWKGAKWALILFGSLVASAGLTDTTIKDLALYVVDWSGIATVSIGALITIAANFVKFQEENA